MASYWGQVLRMARRAKRATGRAGNIVPPEMLGRILRLIWAPIVVIWIVQPFIVGFMLPSSSLLRPLIYRPTVVWICAAVVLAGYLATRRCWKAMGRQWRMGIDPAEKTTMVATGPFAYVRHPIYALSQLMMLATVIAVPSPLMIAAALVHILLLQWESRREERHMLRTQGEPYLEYCRQVGRFLPKRLGPYSG
ncbi:MAG TPA: isoprenylcysteine carboxylmethyltransferase family protein [Humisphaera sp.]|nr:isoprenylcysteine carboxylmethyltransferase family protein [Humisphaera sp.]